MEIKKITCTVLTIDAKHIIFGGAGTGAGAVQQCGSGSDCSGCDLMSYEDIFATKRNGS
jgi:hypothetical protein